MGVGQLFDGSEGNVFHHRSALLKRCTCIASHGYPLALLLPVSLRKQQIVYLKRYLSEARTTSSQGQWMCHLVSSRSTPTVEGPTPRSLMSSFRKYAGREGTFLLSRGRVGSGAPRVVPEASDYEPAA